MSSAEIMNGTLNLSAQLAKGFANSVKINEMARMRLSHQDLHCLPFSILSLFCLPFFFYYYFCLQDIT